MLGPLELLYLLRKLVLKENKSVGKTLRGTVGEEGKFSLTRPVPLPRCGGKTSHLSWES